MQIGFVGLLTFLFVALKLTNVIAWDWVWVLSPVWISAIIWFVSLIGVLVFGWLAMRREDKQAAERRMRR